MTAAIGVSVGSGRMGLALLGTLFAWVVLEAIGHLEKWFKKDSLEKASTDILLSFKVNISHVSINYQH